MILEDSEVDRFIEIMNIPKANREEWEREIGKWIAETQAKWGDNTVLFHLSLLEKLKTKNHALYLRLRNFPLIN